MSHLLCNHCGQVIKKSPLEKHLNQLEAKRRALRSIIPYTEVARKSVQIDYTMSDPVGSLCIAVESIVNYIAHDLNKDLKKHGLDTVELSSQAGIKPQEELEDKECNICQLED